MGLGPGLLVSKRAPVSDNPYPDARLAQRGYRERLTPNTRFKVIEIDFTADPAKDSPEWLAEQYRKLGEAKTRREVLRDWTVSAGDSFYPEYANYGGKTTYSFVARGLLPTFVFRGWDFGIRRPVCVWGQVGASGRVYVLYCMAPEELDTWSFTDLVNFYSGTGRFEDMTDLAKSTYQGYVSSGEWRRGPWFPPGCKFMDFGGDEVFRRTATVKPGDPQADYDILVSKGITLEAPRVAVMDRVKTLRRLLHRQGDGLPGIMIEDGCELVHRMLNGGLGFPKATEAKPHPEQPRKDGWWDNIHDGLTYPIAQLVPMTEGQPPRVVKEFRNGVETERLVYGDEEFEPFMSAR